MTTPSYSELEARVTALEDAGRRFYAVNAAPNPAAGNVDDVWLHVVEGKLYRKDLVGDPAEPTWVFLGLLILGE